MVNEIRWLADIENTRAYGTFTTDDETPGAREQLAGLKPAAQPPPDGPPGSDGKPPHAPCQAPAKVL